MPACILLAVLGNHVTKMCAFFSFTILSWFPSQDSLSQYNLSVLINTIQTIKSYVTQPSLFIQPDGSDI